jgi:2-polyprenyl-3-methyl-5-hydroxy-6-metoxy-1,4-benzoquinol methylase
MKRDDEPSPTSAVARWFQGGAFASDARTALLFATMRLAIVADYSAERLFTALRKCGLELCALGSTVAPGGLALMCSLAGQCFLNEYVWAETAEEGRLVAHLLDRLHEALAGSQEVPPAWIATIGCYLPLGKIPGADRLLEHSWPEAIAQLLTQQIAEPASETAIRATIARLTPIDDATSSVVRAQYEANPYPRWVRTVLDRPSGSVQMALRAALPDGVLTGGVLTGAGAAAPDILVAGCGTGLHPIETSRRFAGSRVLAIDLSTSSLAYAQRKAREYGIDNIEFAQADILALGSLERRFDIIECIGVLHHLRVPEEGCRILRDLLRPRGLMMLGLYSEIARTPIAHVRAAAAARGYSTSPSEIRRFRQQAFDFLDAETLAELLTLDDFYSVSGCRDLLFHEQEHRFTLSQIAGMLDRLGLDFLGFELPPPIGPQGRHRRDLDAWDEFERSHPHTFRGMYQFWLRPAV